MNPTFTATKVVRLPEADSGIDKAIVRIYSGRIDASKTDPARFRRRQPVLLINEDTGGRTLLFAMGAGAVRGISRSAVGIDYDARDALGLCYRDGGDTVSNITVRPASYRDIVRHYWGHPDMGYQVSIRIGLLGLSLGLLGAFLGGLSLFF